MLLTETCYCSRLYGIFPIFGRILNSIYWFLIKRAHHRILFEGLWQQIWFFLCWFWHFCINLLLMFRWFFLLQENMIWTFLMHLGKYFAWTQAIIQSYYLAHVIEKPNLRIPNPQYFLLFKWKFDNFFIHFEFDRGDKKTKCIHKLNVIKKIVVNIRDSEFVNLVFRWREQDKYFENFNFLQKEKKRLSHFLFCKAFKAKKLKSDWLFKRKRNIWNFF